MFGRYGGGKIRVKRDKKGLRMTYMWTRGQKKSRLWMFGRQGGGGGSGKIHVRRGKRNRIRGYWSKGENKCLGDMVVVMLKRRGLRMTCLWTRGQKTVRGMLCEKRDGGGEDEKKQFQKEVRGDETE
ncbi:hypothetical protein SNE40_021437 [Patella caerulea]|uniref:Uncharacterized protein n=1 Tax=Patella caerulea TaxID=87958 RepID=A0AAN8G4D8_PATCE